jgi:hypothetical protein
MTAAGKADAITVIIKRALVQARDHHDIASNSRQPAMNGDDAIVVLDVEHIHAFAAKRRMLPSEPHKLARESVLIGHVFVFAFSKRLVSPALFRPSLIPRL